jgi:hypothetical protein
MAFRCGYLTGNKGTYSGITRPQGYSRIRVIHNVAKAPNVDVYLDGKNVLSNVPYKAISDYLRVPSGMHQIQVTAAGTDTILFNLNPTLAPNAQYTVIAHGLVSPNSLALLALQDNVSCPAAGNAHVRFVHAAAGAPNVDIYAGDTKIFSNVAYGSTGNPVYLPVAAGDVDISVSPAGSDDIVLGPLPLNLEASKIYTIIASGIVGDNTTPLTALVSEESSGMCVNPMEM